MVLPDGALLPHFVFEEGAAGLLPDVREEPQFEEEELTRPELTRPLPPIRPPPPPPFRAKDG